MIVVTGAAGFIGSCVISRLNRDDRDDIVAVDVLRENDKWKNLRHLRFHEYLDRSKLMPYLQSTAGIEAIVHMGACSSTTERDAHYLMENNYRYTAELAHYAIYNGMRFIYASSAATYGMGEQGYADDEEQLQTLRPMNMYGYSKQLLDLKARRENWLQSIVGLKFFNVYGPNEYFKGEMASVVFKAFNQIKQNGNVRLFKSHRGDYKDGEQLRDFLYVKDAVEVVYFLMQNPAINGIYNVGYGKARSFKDLANATFKAMGRESKIKYIDMPSDIRDRYQYFTEAPMEKLRAAGYDRPFYSLEEGVNDYVQNYLLNDYAHY